MTSLMDITAASSSSDAQERRMLPIAHARGVWQKRWVQNLLPWLTSLSIHATILIVGLLIWGVAKVVRSHPAEAQSFIPESAMVDNAVPGMTLNASFVDADPSRRFEQEESERGSPKSFDVHEKSLALAKAAGEESISPDKTFDGGPGSLGKIGHADGTDLSAGDGFAPPGVSGGGSLGYVFRCEGGNVRRVVFLCDGTGSMLSKMAALKEELSKAVTRLQPTQSFDVLFFQGSHVIQFSQQSAGMSQLIQATPHAKRQAAAFLDGVTSQDVTNPLPALGTALKLHPQLIYFLTDAADFPDAPAVLATISRLNGDRRIRINTILFVEDGAERQKNQDSEGLMKQIANENGGKFRWVEMDAMGR